MAASRPRRATVARAGPAPQRARAAMRPHPGGRVPETRAWRSQRRVRRICGILTEPTGPAQSPESLPLHVRRRTTHDPTAPSRTRPTTVGWIAIILFLFLAGLGAVLALAASACTTR